MEAVTAVCESGAHRVEKEVWFGQIRHSSAPLRQGGLCQEQRANHKTQQIWLRLSVRERGAADETFQRLSEQHVRLSHASGGSARDRERQNSEMAGRAWLFFLAKRPE